MKKILIALVVLGAIAVAAAVLLFANLGNLIQKTVETVGSDATKAKVTLESAEVSFESGEAQLTGLTVGNPEGFATDSAFSLGNITVKVDTSTLNERPIVIDEIVVTEPNVTYELGTGGSNMAAIQRNVDAYVKSLKKAAGRDGDRGGSGAEEGGDETVFVIRNLYVREGKIDVSATLLKGRTVSARLGEIHLRDIGKKDGGATPAQITKELISALTRGTVDAVGGLGIDGLVDDLAKDVLDKAGDAIGKGLDSLFGK